MRLLTFTLHGMRVPRRVHSLLLFASVGLDSHPVKLRNNGHHAYRVPPEGGRHLCLTRGLPVAEHALGTAYESSVVPTPQGVLQQAC